MVNTKAVVRLLTTLLFVDVLEGGCLGPTTITNGVYSEVMGCHEFIGNLTITSENEAKVFLPNLTSVGEFLVITGPKLVEIDLPNLTSVKELKITNVPSLRILKIEKVVKADEIVIENFGHIDYLNITLEPAGEPKEIQRITLANGNVSSIIIKTGQAKQVKLVSLTGVNLLNLAIDEINLLELESLEISELKVESLRVDNFKLESIHKLKRVELPNLNKVVNLEIKNMSQLDHLVFGQLEHSDSVTIENNPNLNQLSFPVLKTIRYNAQLDGSPKATLQMPELLSAEELTLQNIYGLTSPKLENLTSLSCTAFASNTITLESLKSVLNFIEIGNNKNLDRLVLSKVSHKLNALTVENNAKLHEIAIPSLDKVKEVYIYQPSLEVFHYNDKISGRKISIFSKVSCDQINKTQFHFKDCKNSTQVFASMDQTTGIQLTTESRMVPKTVILPPKEINSDASVETPLVLDREKDLEGSIRTNIIDFNKYVPATSQSFGFGSPLVGFFLASLLLVS